MGHHHHNFFHDRYHSSDSCTRAFCNVLFLVISFGAVILILLGIVCLADNGLGYCTRMSIGSFIGLLVSGIILAVFCFILLFCIRCFADAVDHV